jgi:hypothetical protein
MLLTPPAVLSALGVLAMVVGLVRFSSLRSLRRKFADPIPAAFPYRACPSLVTKNEMLYYKALRRAVGTEFTVALKVRLADIITCQREAWSMGYGRLIAQKHIDFLLCDPATLRVVLALEIDDRSHARPKRRLRDLFVDRALGAAGVPLVRIRAAASYEPLDIKHVLSTHPGLKHRRKTCPSTETLLRAVLRLE